MPFYDDLAGTDTHADLVLALRIEGIPVAFVERAIPAAIVGDLAGYTQFACVTRVEEGEAVLDMDERREMAATLQIDLLDDDAKTLAALFAVNKRRTTFLTADAAAGATTLTVNDTIALSNGQTVYTDGETITIGTVASGVSLTGCTRGAFGSTALVLYGTPTGFESPIYTAPPSWSGRRATLYGYALDANGGGTAALLGTWIIDEPPRHTGDLSWSLSLASVAQEFYERSIGVGLSEAVVKDKYVTTTISSRDAYRFPVDTALGFRLGSSFPTYAILRSDNDAQIFEVAAVDTGTNEVTIYADPMYGSRSGFRLADLLKRAEKLQPVQFVGGSPAAMLYILLSREGQGATTYDRIPGRLPAASDPGWRFGAGFVSTEVDATTWTSFDNARPFNVCIDKEQRVSDVLREWCILNGAATRITTDGKLSVFLLSTPRVTSSTTLGTNSVVPDSRIEVVADEAAIYPIATVRCDYSPLEGDYRAELNLIDTVTAKRYPRTQERKEMELRSVGIADQWRFTPNAYANAVSLSIGEIQQIAVDVQRGDNGLARRYVSLSLTLAHLALRIGDVVVLSGTLPDAFSSLPDLRGGTLAGARCRVVSRRPRYDEGRMDVRLYVLDSLLVVSPGAVIASAVGTTLTLATVGPEVSGASPADDYFVGQAVRIYDISGAVYHSTTVASRISATQITITAAPAFVIAGNSDYIVADPAATTIDGVTTSGYSQSEFAAVANAAGQVNTLAVATTYEPRWR